MFAQVSSWLVPLIAAATVPAIASVVAAVESARSARASRAAELDAQRIQSLEERLAERKYGVYKPMIETLRSILDSKGADLSADAQQAHITRLSEFAAWISIFGSDEAVRVVHNFMQAAFCEAPPTILLRIYADFVIAARHDMGDVQSTVTPLDILGLRITDLYSSNLSVAASLPFAELCERESWVPPWRDHRTDDA